jgi:16S rRNA (cytosine967-C5)-methyltransferase
VSSSADRLTAARILLRVEGGAYASRLLSSRVSAGVRARVLGVLRWQRALDEVFAVPLRRSVDGLDAEVRVTLRMGLFESARMGVPAAVATDAAIHMVRRLGRASAAGLVNAVLRRAIPLWPEVLEASPVDVQLSHPEWLAHRWTTLFGGDSARGSMQAALEPAPVWVWWIDDDSRRDLVDQGVQLRSHPWCPGAWCADDRSADVIAQVSDGAAYVQDPSSQLVAHLASRLLPDRGRLADLCAAPGGKAALSSRLSEPTAVVGLDNRLGRVRLMLDLLQPFESARSVVGDAATPPLPTRSWDLVLVDAPCSGTGTFRRHPELKWRIEPKDVDDARTNQSRILAGGLGLVAPGGALLYATCSIEPEENEELFEAVPPGFERVELGPILPAGVPWIPTDAAGIRILPHLDGDGFTMHALRRRPQ